MKSSEKGLIRYVRRSVKGPSEGDVDNLTINLNPSPVLPHDYPALFYDKIDVSGVFHLSTSYNKNTMKYYIFLILTHERRLQK